MAAASGVLFGPLVGVNHAMGLDWVLKAFIVVVVGGMGNLGGSILAAIFISLLEAYASIWVSPSQAIIVSSVVLILTSIIVMAVQVRVTRGKQTTEEEVGKN